jgi:hypothetical protein
VRPSEVNTLIGVDQAGFANLSSGVAVMIDRLQEANHLRDENPSLPRVVSVNSGYAAEIVRR